MLGILHNLAWTSLKNAISWLTYSKELTVRITGSGSDYTEEAMPDVVHPRLDASARHR